MLSRYGPGINLNSIIDLHNLVPVISQSAVYILILVLRRSNISQLDDDQFKCGPHKRDFGVMSLEYSSCMGYCADNSAAPLSILQLLGKYGGCYGDNNSPGLIKRNTAPSSLWRCSRYTCTVCDLRFSRRRIE